MTRRSPNRSKPKTPDGDPSPQILSRSRTSAATSANRAEPSVSASISTRGPKPCRSSTVNYHLDDAEGATGYYHRGHYGGGHDGTERRIVSQRHIANRYATQLANKKRQLDRMQHAANKITQIIHGHDGETIITLETMSDMSSELALIEIGDIITWNGKRAEASETSEYWYAESIEKIEDRHGK